MSYRPQIWYLYLPLVALHVCQISAWSKYAFPWFLCLCEKKNKKTRNKNWNFAHLYLGNSWRNLLQFWNVASPYKRALPQQIWCSSDKRWRIYECVKIATLLFLLRMRAPRFLVPCVLIVDMLLLHRFFWAKVSSRDIWYTIAIWPIVKTLSFYPCRPNQTLHEILDGMALVKLKTASESGEIIYQLRLQLLITNHKLLAPNIQKYIRAK